MSPRLQRWLPAVLAVLAVLVWIGPLQWLTSSVAQISDIPTYQGAYERMADGAIPYRDFPLEYPPLAALVFWIAGVLPGSYSAAFSALMLVALVLTVIPVTLTARELGLGPVRQVAAGGIVALSPILLGGLLESRFDLVLAALIAWILWAVVTDRMTLAWSLLGVAILVKLVPIAFIPVLAMVHARRHGGSGVLRGATVGLMIILLVAVPFAITAPSGLWESVSYHLDRPLQLESTGAAYLMGMRLLADVPLAVETSFGSQGLAGEAPEVIGLISTIVMVVLIVAVALTVLRLLADRTPGADSSIFVAGIAATSLALLVGGKVLSPQFLIWILPSVLLIRGRMGWGAVGVAVLALLATHAYFPSRYWDLVALREPEMGLLVLRDAVLIALLALAWPRPGMTPGHEPAMRGRLRDVAAGQGTGGHR